VSTDAEIIRKELSTPRAAAIAGVVFSLLLGASLVLVRISVPTNPSDAKQWLADSGRRHAVLVAVNLVPFAGIAFLWFIGVIRDRLGDREDRFFATVFLGSGLLFVAMLFGAAAVTGSLATGFRGGVATSTGSSQTWHFGGSLAHTLLTTYGMRMAAVFMITMTTITLRHGVIPRWLGIAGLASALALLLGVNVVGWLELLFPLYVLAVSIHLLLQSFRPHPLSGKALQSRAFL
jgi:hypothetical protein